MNYRDKELDIGFSSSNSEARRLISQGALKVNGNKIDAFKITDICDGDVIQAGKLKFIRIRIKGLVVGKADCSPMQPR